MKSYSLKELKGYNGKNGNKVYFAYKGLIYDVTGSFYGIAENIRHLIMLVKI